jgi:hypothetical protein
MAPCAKPAKQGAATVATLPVETLSRPPLVYRIRDKVTGEQRTVRSMTLAVEIFFAAGTTGAGTAGADIVLIDPHFDETRCGDIVMLCADLMRLAYRSEYVASDLPPAFCNYVLHREYLTRVLIK